MLELKYKSWKDVTIDTYFYLRNGLRKMYNDNASQNDINMYLISFLCDVPIEDVYKSKISELNKVSSEIKWVTEKVKRSIVPTTIKINGEKYDIRLNMNKCNVAQYIDFNEYSKNMELFYRNLLACIIIPKGKEYNEGYDAVELAEKLGKTLDIQTAESIYLSFAIASMRLTRLYLWALRLKTMRYLIETKKEGMTPMRVKEMRTIVLLKRQIALLNGLKQSML